MGSGWRREPRDLPTPESRRTGLSRSTVSSLVADLRADRLVIERAGLGAVYGAQGGRPPILRAFDASAGAAVGIAFGHVGVRVAVSDLSSTILAERAIELDVDHEAKEGLDAAAELVTGALAEAGVQRRRVIGAGVALPAPIHRATDIVGSSVILPGWVGVTAAEELRNRLELPVLVENDANLGALAEATYGAGREAVDLVYLMVSWGIGAGLVLNGRLYRGSLGLAGEIGHVATPGGAVCRCGNRGCLETVIASPVLLELLRPTHGPLTVGEMLELARGGDPGCRHVLADAGRALGEAAAMLLNVLNPELVVVGGELAAAGDLLLDGVRESLRRGALPAASEAAWVAAGTLGERSEVLGAIALVVSQPRRRGRQGTRGPAPSPP
jgi:predicted NBD/HSP70 family sugar kinase